MTYKSYTEEEIKEALEAGKQVWELDSGNAGEDDVLIGTKKEVINDLCACLEVEELPEGWDLYKVASSIRPEIYEMLDEDTVLQEIIASPEWSSANPTMPIAAVARIRAVLWHPPEGEIAGHDDPDWNAIAREYLEFPEYQK